jgi:hypothetical protein
MGTPALCRQFCAERPVPEDDASVLKVDSSGEPDSTDSGQA